MIVISTPELLYNIRKKELEQMFNELGKIGSIERWSVDAINCYKRGCICEGCPIKNLISSKCFMKSTVIELVKKLGAPKEMAYKSSEPLILDNRNN